MHLGSTFESGWVETETPPQEGSWSSLRLGGEWEGCRFRDKEEGEQFREGKDGADAGDHYKPFSSTFSLSTSLCRERWGQRPGPSWDFPRTDPAMMF